MIGMFAYYFRIDIEVGQYAERTRMMKERADIGGMLREVEKASNGHDYDDDYRVVHHLHFHHYVSIVRPFH